MSGRVFAGARALYRAAGVSGDDMGKKPIIAIANSFDEFLPGHVHLNKVGRIVSEAIKEAGGIPREFNTMAVDDGIAMGHTGMLYSLPSRDIIADTVEYQCNAHCADALICIPNCDKVVPGMLMAALRLNIPTVFVSGGPMEAGTTVLADGTVKSTDLIDVMYATADDNVSDEELLNYEKTVCPTCGSCAGMFTANSMNCLTEAIGLALPGNGTILASHSYRKDLFKRAAKQVVKIAHQYYDDSDDSVLPRSIATKEAFENAMTMDVAMGGSTNTVLHILAMAQSADVDFTLDDIERISHTVPCICKASPSGKWEISDVHRAGGITGILGELDRAGKLHTNVHSIDYPTLEAKLPIGTSCARPAPRKPSRCTRPLLATSSPRSRGRTPPCSTRSTATAPTAPSTTSTTRRFTKAASPCCAATWPPTAAWSRPPVFRRRSGSSVDRLWWSTPRSRPSRSF